MEILKPNYVDTTGVIEVESSTSTVNALFNPDIRFQYVSDGWDDDTTQTSIIINFDETLTVSKIGLSAINLKEFDIFYDGVTANTFAITTTGTTIASSFATNSETSMFIHVDAVGCTSVTLDLKSTIVANSEKAIGYLYIGDEHLDFSRIPSAKNYKPALIPKEVIHKLSDGGTRVQYITDKYDFSIKFKNITKLFRDELKVVYNLKSETVFVPFGTMTGWDEIIAPTVWTGPFEFYKHSDNAVDAGFEGRIRLKETSVG